MNQLVVETARKIENITPSKTSRELTVLHFEGGSKESFMKWFMEKHQPKVGDFLVKDTQGFTQVVNSL
ncbi:hypothetical protein CPT_Moabite_206 [Serratia phage Moabite]|uniref:Uncharacterized protein n=3 Tax=Moabitevirus TaxID=2843422 RepID=A0A7T3TM02_9CAUD|nr:hypothetical protein HWB23_gp132 [Serratia phage vB_SmaM_ 2050HW]YP_009849300.1 hypothetical protein HWC48_gp210 [Serratia phage Moabite]QPX76945.1 hypothetical protein [Serratia phage vB_SmaM_Yaphecito]UCR74733.1 hypothetical protein [Serratia phage BUCT660]UGO54092.1 hypothetical protein HAYMO_110 [Serratia phage vB_SmaM_Haymo]UQT03600.1 hypothetical protein KODAMA_01330 [Serratia phage vB_SmaM-Kodama]URG13993.1 hypothetical protein [Pectobacterium phage vB_ParM-25]